MVEEKMQSCLILSCGDIKDDGHGKGLPGLSRRRVVMTAEKGLGTEGCGARWRRKEQCVRRLAVKESSSTANVALRVGHENKI